MINNIVNTFRQQALEHRAIKAFYYNKTYQIGSGKGQYPLLWLEDPIVGQNMDNVFVNTVNFSILLLPSHEKTVIELQNLAFSAGLNIIERVKKDTNSEMRIHPDWIYTTIQNYSDDNACGCRFTVNFTQLNMQNLCLIEEQFDAEAAEDKMKEQSGLPSFELFPSKLPDFDLKTRKDQVA